MNNSASKDIIVKLNVGGQIFHTTPTTLKESEFLTRMLEGSIPTMKDENGAYFIDRDPKYFEIILSFMRTFKWDIPPTISKDKVLQEAEFYLLRTIDGIADREKQSPPQSGLYTLNNVYYFSHDGHCIANDLKTKEPVTTSKNIATIKRYGANTVVGFFVNDNQNFINHIHYPLKRNWSRPPKTLLHRKIKRPSGPSIVVKAYPEVVTFYQGEGKICDCLYETDPVTGLVYAKYSGSHLKLMAYFFGNRMVVDLNGDWKYYKSDDAE